MTDINEEIARLRSKMIEAIRVGFLDKESCATFEVALMQIMGESDRQRRNCVNRADQLKMQAATAEGQGAAFGMISSIINNVVAAMIRKTEQASEEERAQSEAEAEAEKIGTEAETEAEAEAEAEVEDVEDEAKADKKRSRKKVVKV